jgi:hypothetical protein
MNSQVSRDLRDLLRAEERTILNTFPPVERRVAVLDLVRSIDYFYLWQNSRREPTNPREEETDMFLIYGCNKALQLFLDKSTQNEMVPLHPSTEESRTWANSILYHCGEIAICEMLLDWERAHLGTFVIRDGTTRFECTDRAIGLEAYEAEEFYWLRGFVADNQQSLMDSLMEMLPRIQQIMTPLVRPWRDHYIRYETTPEIDSYYQQRGILQCHIMFGHDAFPGQARFGGLEFDLYRASVATLAGWMLRHLDFARILKQKYPNLEISNLLTIHQDKKVLAGYLAATLGIHPATAEQCLRVLTLTHTDTPELTVPKGPPAPLVQLGKAHVLKSVAGCLNAPFDFMGTSLRRKYPGDWDKAVSLRERTFRNELYSLFPQREITCVPTQVKIRQGNQVVTDVDAAIFDPHNNIGGLFQLKWQEPFGPSVRARDSRKRNFLPPTIAWIDQILAFLQDLSPRKLADSFGLKLSDAEEIKQFRLFVIGRNFSHFSGEKAPDERTAWGLWPQLLHLAAEQYDHANPLDGLFHGLKRTSPFLKPRPEVEDIRFSLGNKEIVLTTRAAELPEIRAAK